jgi:type VI secretion system protein ImpL
MDFFRQRLMNKASCHIQFKWEGDVLAHAGRLAPAQLQQALFASQGGLVRDFADNTLKYILHHTLNGYRPEILAGDPIPFTEDFIAFLNAGVSEYTPLHDEYGLTFSALPANVNEGAAETPYAVELSLHCAREKQSFVNYNSPASALFTWREDTCGDTSLTIRFRSATLNVLYAGANGFLDFLNDFHYGEKIFKRQDFPAQEAALAKLGIGEITIQYWFAGADELLSSRIVMAGEPPAVAAFCLR